MRQLASRSRRPGRGALPLFPDQGRPAVHADARAYGGADRGMGRRPARRQPTRRRRLSAFVENHIGFHIARRHSTHVSNMELRSLSPDRLTQILRTAHGL